MSPKIAILALGALTLAACAVPPPAPASAPAPAPVPPAAPTPTPVVMPTTPIAIRSFSCADLLAAADDDRGYASMFFLGYRAALAHTRTIDIAKIEAIERTALKFCAASPDMTASQAFAEALAANME